MESSYYKCNFFDKTIENLNNFLVKQEELNLTKIIEDKTVFEKKDIVYSCGFSEYNKADWSKPTGIICIKDNIELLSYTLNNLNVNKVYDHINFIIVDDRSSRDIKEVCNEYPISYLRVDNDKGFNFSMLNNIAAKIAYEKGSKQIILWNSDLFVPDENQIPQLLELHEKNESTISGVRLIYPPFSWNNEEVSHNISSVFPNKSNTYRDTVQFGGSMFAYHVMLKSYFPNHYCRFKEKDYYLVTVDKLETFVTGAFQIIDLEWFIQSGGLNSSMALNFQDVDLCMRAVKQDKKVYYFGKNNFLYHDESVSISKEKKSKQFHTDHILFAKIWNEREYVTSILKHEF